MTVPPLFHSLFDDAALFPPGNAAMPAAVTAHAGYRHEWYAGLVAAFVCPAGRLAELDAAQAELDAALAAGSPPLPSPEISLTVPGGPAELAGALASAARQPQLTVRSVELPVRAGELGAALDELGQAAERGLRVFAEIAFADLGTDLAVALRRAGLGLKLRTGGGTAAAFPDIATLAAALETAVAAGVRFKCTAGLHNAVGHHDPVTGWSYHGFLNVLLAVHAAQDGSGATAELLASRDGDDLAARARSLAPAEVDRLRGQFGSIGSCSILEPLTDLTTLRLVSAA